MTTTSLNGGSAEPTTRPQNVANGVNGHPSHTTEAAAPSEPIAVVGMSIRFPGEATSPEAFWDMLVAGRSAWSEIPKNRFNVDAYYHPNPDRIDAVRS